MNIISKKKLNNQINLIDINNMIDKIDLISNKLNIPLDLPNKKNIYTIDDLLNIFNKLEQKNLSNNNEYNNNESNNLSNMEKFILILEDEICIKKNIYLDDIFKEIINCIQTESKDVKKVCSNKIKFILQNYNNISSNIKTKLNMLNDLIINSK
jgi:hypothetical protein